MKKFLCLIVCIIFSILLVGCKTTLSKGQASRVDFIDGWAIGNATFEYLNETTVKIVRTSDGQIFIVPTSSIDMIWVIQ